MPENFLLPDIGVQVVCLQSYCWVSQSSREAVVWTSWWRSSRSSAPPLRSRSDRSTRIIQSINSLRKLVKIKLSDNGLNFVSSTLKHVSLVYVFPSPPTCTFSPYAMDVSCHFWCELALKLELRVLQSMLLRFMTSATPTH